MRDLLVIVPSRGRPERLAVMLNACLSLAEADTAVAVAFDDDDAVPYRRLMLDRFLDDVRGVEPLEWHCGPRKSLAAWTNELAAKHLGGYRALASLGDDHVPRTLGWDRLLLEALDAVGGQGIAYGNDLHQGEALPTAPVISAGIVKALGWMMEPALRHMHVDDVWRDLGQAAGCLAYVPGVVIEHRHPDAGKAPEDQVYAESLEGAQDDREAYYRWRAERMAGDVAKIRALRERR